MSKRRISNETLKTTGFKYTHSGIPNGYTLLLINGKYKMTILYTLTEYRHIDIIIVRSEILCLKNI